MSLQNDLLHDYHELLKLSDFMLAQARSGSWDELVANEATYLRSVKDIAYNLDNTALPSALRIQLRSLIKQILDNEVLIKELIAQRMEELRTLVLTTSQQQKVTAAYGRLSNDVLYPQNL